MAGDGWGWLGTIGDHRGPPGSLGTAGDPLDIGGYIGGFMGETIVRKEIARSVTKGKLLDILKCVCCAAGRWG